jgi:hypothetical protein
MANQVDLTALYKTRIQELLDLHSRLQSIRHLPQSIVQVPKQRPDGVTSPSSGTNAFEQLKTFEKDFLSDKTQESLKAAVESERKDKSGITSDWRQEEKRRKWVFL